MGYSIRLATDTEKQLAISGDFTIFDVLSLGAKSVKDIKDDIHKPCYVVFNGPMLVDIAPAREIIKKVKAYQRKVGNKSLKHFDHTKNRTKTRDLVQTENFDAIPQNQSTHKEDPWSWD